MPVCGAPIGVALVYYKQRWFDFPPHDSIDWNFFSPRGDNLWYSVLRMMVSKNAVTEINVVET